MEMSLAYDTAPGALYRLDARGRLTMMLPEVTISNGIDWSPDGSAMFYVDSTTRRIDVFDYDLETGALSGQRVFATVEDRAGLPDGLTVDTEGGVWVALFGGGQVRRYAPDGRLDRVVEVPGAELVTACGFAGPGLDLLYITISTEKLTNAQRQRQPGAGRLYRAVPGFRGRPATRFPVTREAVPS